jgi:hypothetical protein
VARIIWAASAVSAASAASVPAAVAVPGVQGGVSLLPGLDRLQPACGPLRSGCRGRSGTWLRGLSLQVVSGIRDGPPGWFGARRSSQRPDKYLGVWVTSLCRPRCMSPVSRRTPAPAIGGTLDLTLTMIPSRPYPAVTVGPNVRLHRRQTSHYVWPKIGWITRRNPYIPTGRRSLGSGNFI